MGTPNFALPALKKLIANPEIEVVGVYSREPKKSGRGQKLTLSPTHDFALKNNIKVFTPKNFKSEESIQQFQNLNADIALVVAYGIILPKIILESTKFGIINIHPSILPKYRGATPIQSTLLSGDSEIGCTIIKMDEGIDSGDIISQQIFSINLDDNYANLAPKLAEIGAEMALKAVFDIRDNKAKFVKQDEKLANLSKKINKNDAKIDFNASKTEIINQIRALSDFLTAFFIFRGEKIMIYQAKIVEDSQIKDCEKYQKAEIGEVFNDKFMIKCKDGAIQPLILQKSGKKKISIKDFLNGFKL